MLSCSPSLLEFAHRQPAGSANSHSRRQTRKTAAFRAGRTPVKAGLYSGCSDPRSKLAQGTTNHLYSVSAITNLAGQVVERYSYNAYGVRTVKNPANVVIAKSAVGNDRGFTSYKLDGETGLYAARARMYSAKLGRFIGRDKLGYADSYSLYMAFFSPNYVDPYGTSAIVCIFNCHMQYDEQISSLVKELSVLADKIVSLNEKIKKLDEDIRKETINHNSKLHEIDITLMAEVAKILLGANNAQDLIKARAEITLAETKANALKSNEDGRFNAMVDPWVDDRNSSAKELERLAPKARRLMNDLEKAREDLRKCIELCRDDSPICSSSSSQNW